MIYVEYEKLMHKDDETGEETQIGIIGEDMNVDQPDDGNIHIMGCDIDHMWLTQNGKSYRLTPISFLIDFVIHTTKHQFCNNWRKMHGYPMSRRGCYGKI